MHIFLQQKTMQIQSGEQVGESAEGSKSMGMRQKVQ